MLGVTYAIILFSNTIVIVYNTEVYIVKGKEFFLEIRCSAWDYSEHDESTQNLRTHLSVTRGFRSASRACASSKVKSTSALITPKPMPTSAFRLPTSKGTLSSQTCPVSTKKSATMSGIRKRRGISGWFHTLVHLHL